MQYLTKSNPSSAVSFMRLFFDNRGETCKFLHQKSYIVHINDQCPYGFLNFDGPGSSRALGLIELCFLYDSESIKILSPLES